MAVKRHPPKFSLDIFLSLVLGTEPSVFFTFGYYWQHPLCGIFLWPGNCGYRETGALGSPIDSTGLKKLLDYNLRCRLPAVQSCHSSPSSSMLQGHMAQCGFTTSCDTLVFLGFQITTFGNLHAYSWSCSNKTRPHWRACVYPRVWRTLLEVSVVMCPQNSSFPIRATFMWHPRILHKLSS